jgi:hypothetical protein
MATWLRTLLGIGLAIIAGATIHAQINRSVIVRVNGEPLFHVDIEAEAGNLTRDYIRSASGLGDATADDGKRLMAALFPSAAIRVVEQLLIAQRGRAMGLKAPESGFPTAVQQMMTAMGARTREELDKALAREGGSIDDVRRVWERSTLLDLTLRSQVRGNDQKAFEAFMQPLRSGARLEWQRDDLRQAFEARGFAPVTGALLAGNEALAVSTLRQIVSAQLAYAAACTSGQYAASFENLTRTAGNTVPFMDPELKPAGTRMTRGGYAFTLVPEGPVTQTNTCNGAGPVASGFTVFAAPVTPDATGIRHFATSEAGTIYQNFGGPISSVRGSVKPASARPIL